MPKRKRGLTTDEIQKVLADLEDEIFDDSDSDCELENEEDDLITAQQKINRNYAAQALLQDFYFANVIRRMKITLFGKWHGNYGVPVPKLGTYLLIRINKRELN
ncbi:hypothetical protein TNCV_992251 [Trichonephila clavipes]|nr:hypothetical protein TNCV_992251 [Trichonephila clavipes]